MSARVDGVSAAASAAARRNPWWIPPFLGRVPDIEPRLVNLLGFVAFALLFENYDFSLLNAALKHIARDLQIAESDLGYFTALVRLGALPAFALIPAADYLGRRRLFLIAVIGLSSGTFLTAFSQTATQFVVFQIITRTFMLTAASVAFVFVTEEFPAQHRGWGIGMLAAIASSGYGLGALLFAAVDVLPFGWRALYVVGFTPVLLLPLFRRGITETKRYTDHRANEARLPGLTAAITNWFRPLLALAEQNRARAAGIVLVGAMTSFGHAVVHAFIGYFVLTFHKWEPWQYSIMVVLCGAIGIIGSVIAGNLADRFGRRAVGFTFLAAFPMISWAFFRGPGWTLPVVWIAIVFATMAANVIVRALSTELFPTSRRATSAGLLSLAETVGAGIGLFSLSLLTREEGDLVAMLPIVSSATLISALLLLLFPETKQAELETISSEAPPFGPVG
jgi:MFS family permease